MTAPKYARAGAALGKWLKQQGIGQSDLAAKLTGAGATTHQGTVSHWISGDRRPGPVQRYALAIITGIDESEWWSAEERRVARRVEQSKGAA